MRGKFAAGAPPMGPEVFLPIALVIGYLFGSVPFGIILTRLAGTEDLRSIGSGSIGATNVLRTGRKGLAAATVLLDMGKGTLAAGLLGRLDLALLFLGFALIVIWKHRSNIARLFAGTEPRVGKGRG